METQIRWCSECRDEQVFEQPVCEDGHGPECRDLFCAMCGLGIHDAILIAIAEDRTGAATRRTHAA